MDPQRAGPFTLMYQGGERGRDRSGATRSGLTDTPLVHPHRHRAVHRRGQHLNIDTVGELGAIERYGGADIECGQFVVGERRI